MKGNTRFGFRCSVSWDVPDGGYRLENGLFIPRFKSKARRWKNYEVFTHYDPQKGRGLHLIFANLRQASDQDVLQFVSRYGLPEEPNSSVEKLRGGVRGYPLETVRFYVTLLWAALELSERLGKGEALWTVINQLEGAWGQVLRKMADHMPPESANVWRPKVNQPQQYTKPVPSPTELQGVARDHLRILLKARLSSVHPAVDLQQQEIVWTAENLLGALWLMWALDFTQGYRLRRCAYRYCQRFFFQDRRRTVFHSTKCGDNEKRLRSYHKGSRSRESDAGPRLASTPKTL